MKISIIVPVLNEASVLPSFLSHVRLHAPEEELIIADGGSVDGSYDLAAELERKYNCQFVKAPRGRASQMNCGGRIASGEILWFLHADSGLPGGCIGAIRAAYQDPDLVGGCFRLRMASPRMIYRVSDLLGNFAVDLFRISLGDHGIFCRRDFFERTGGYPPVPIMEDARLYQAMQAHGAVRQLRSYITTSVRTYEMYGPVRTTLYFFAILALYVAGAPIEVQQRLYQQLQKRRIRNGRSAAQPEAACSPPDAGK